MILVCFIEFIECFDAAYMKAVILKSNQADTYFVGLIRIQVHKFNKSHSSHTHILRILSVTFIPFITLITSATLIQCAIICALWSTKEVC